jgi:glycosyltransferase involved in cell wall biosynthesis
MKIAVFDRNYGTSFKVYQANVCRHLVGRGVEFEHFGPDRCRVPENADLVWIQGAPIVDTCRVLKVARSPIITTIHGVDQFTVPLRQLTTSAWQRHRWRIKKPIQRCFWYFVRRRIAAVITVSEYCKKRVREVYGFHPEKMHRIYHGYDASVFHEEVSPYPHDRPYLLHVSMGGAKKNIPGLLRAYELMCNDADVDLLIVAPKYRGVEPRDGRVRFVGEGRTVGRETLARLYRGAVGFVFPSFDETFGLPILEAMACGCPVITSDRSACVEVAGEAGLLVNAWEVSEIACAMRRLLCEPGLREELIARLREQRERFSWEKSARRHQEVFRSVIEHSASRGG